jgi:hypothetical protein
MSNVTRLLLHEDTTNTIVQPHAYSARNACKELMGYLCWSLFQRVKAKDDGMRIENEKLSFSTDVAEVLISPSKYVDQSRILKCGPTIAVER